MTVYSEAWRVPVLEAEVERLRELLGRFAALVEKTIYTPEGYSGPDVWWKDEADHLLADALGVTEAECDHGHSALGGLMDKLRAGERLSDEAIDEIERLLFVLQGEGWSGFITADEAARAIVRAGRETEAE